MSTQQNSLVTVSVDGQSIGVFDTRSGGESSAETPKHRPGGMGGEKTYAGLPTYGDVTTTRVNERERDVELVATRLRPRAGRARMVVTDQPLDDDGLPFGKPTTYIGRMMGVNTGDSDSTSSELRMLELTMSTEEVS